MSSRPDDPVRRMTGEEAELLVDGWGDGVGTSDHVRLEMEAAWWRGRWDGRPVPLPDDAPVPGCTCEECTGLPAHQSSGRRPRRSSSAALDVTAARAVPIVEVARLVGLNPRRRGRDAWAQCPFHEDTNPSLHLNARKQRAFCNPCGQSWDGISLVRAVRRCNFATAVQELAGSIAA